MARWNRSRGREYDREYRQRDSHSDFHYRTPLDRGNEREVRRLGERFFGNERERDHYRGGPFERPFPPRDTGAIGYGREYSSGLNYDPYYRDWPQPYDRDFRRSRRGYDRGF